VSLALVFLVDAAWSAVAAVGFAVLFSVPRRYLPGCLLAAALGHATRALCLRAGASLEASTLIGATAVGVVAMAFSRRMRAPMTLFSLGAIIPLVPGVLAYKTMLGILDLLRSATPRPELAAEVLVLGARTGLVVGAIAFGVVTPSLLFQKTDR
jgi:uncharacterized membrane protein YjjB (DUF3815 family)